MKLAGLFSKSPSVLKGKLIKWQNTKKRELSLKSLYYSINKKFIFRHLNQWCLQRKSQYYVLFSHHAINVCRKNTQKRKLILHYPHMPDFPVTNLQSLLTSLATTATHKLSSTTILLFLGFFLCLQFLQF